MDKALYQALKTILETEYEVKLTPKQYGARLKALGTIKEAIKPYDEIADKIIKAMDGYQYQRNAIYWSLFINCKKGETIISEDNFNQVFEHLLETGKIKPVQWVNDPTVTGYEVVK